MIQPLLHIFDGLAVESKNALDGRVRHSVEKQEEQGGLGLQRCVASTSSVHKDWVQVVSIEVCLTTKPITTMSRHPVVNIGLKL